MHRRTRFAAAAAGLVTAGVVALGAAGAPAEPVRAAQAGAITPKGVGKLRLGMRFDRARKLGLVAQAKQGCDLDRRSRYAKLTRPLKGTVDLTNGSPRRIARISIRGGATARGVGIGDSLAELKAAYPRAKVDKGRVSTFGFWFVRVGRRAGGPLEFTVETKGANRVFQVDLPRYGFCE